jgi:hypothetical protein
VPVRLGFVKKIIPVLALVLAAAACDGGGEAVPSTEAPGVSTTTTTVPSRVCADLASDAIEWVEDLAAELEGIRYEVLVDRALWPESLVLVDERGDALQAESDAAGCDEGLIRGAVVAAAAQMEADGRAAQLLLDLLAPGS